MKKLVLTSVAMLAATGAALAQGTVQWTVISPAAFTVETNTTEAFGTLAPVANGTIGLTTATAGAFYYELLYATSGTAAPTTITALKTWSDSGLEADNSASAGKVVVIGSTSDATVPFTVASEIMMVGWSANLGTTWAAAETSLASLGTVVGTPLLGESTLALFTPNAAGVSPGAVPFGTGGASQIDDLNTPLYVVATPEPTTIALGVMGGLSLLALRRKKA